MTVARLARRLLLEPYHAIVYFTPEARQALADTGLRGFWMGVRAVDRWHLGRAG